MYGGPIIFNTEQLKDIQAQLNHRATTPAKKHDINGVKVVENEEENRLQLFFEGKPEDNIREKLKKCGFRWAPSNGCWQAYLNSNTGYKFKNIILPLLQAA